MPEMFHCFSNCKISKIMKLNTKLCEKYHYDNDESKMLIKFGR